MKIQDNPVNNQLLCTNLGSKGDKLCHITSYSSNCTETLCGLPRGRMDSLCSFPMYSPMACTDCLNEVQNAMLGNGKYKDDES